MGEEEEDWKDDDSNDDDWKADEEREPVEDATKWLYRKDVDKAKWVLMVHMAADAPNLEEPLRFDFEELSRPLKEIGANHGDYIIVIVQVDTASGISKRYRLTHTDPTNAAFFRTPPNSLRRFVNYVTRRCPGKRYALVVWGHASGIGRGLEKPLLTRGLGLIREQPIKSIKQLPRRLDVVGFDACFMASIEVAYELRKRTTQYLLAPQANISLKGWHYDQLLDQVIAHPAITPQRLGSKVIDQVGLSLSSPEVLSLLVLNSRLEKDGKEDRPQEPPPCHDETDPLPVEHIANALKALVSSLLYAYSSPHREPQMRRWIFEAFLDAAWSGVRQFLDLGDLCRHLASRIPDRCVRENALWVLEELSRPHGGRALNLERCEQRMQLEPHAQRLARPLGPPVAPPDRFVSDQLSMLEVPLCGVSIYCPWPRATKRQTRAGIRNVEVDPQEYKGLEFVTCTGWGDLMFDRRLLQQAERHWIRREVGDGGTAVMRALSGRADDPKGWDKADDPKPGGRPDDPKPGGRADDPKPAGRGDEDGRHRYHHDDDYD